MFAWLLVLLMLLPLLGTGFIYAVGQFGHPKSSQIMLWIHALTSVIAVVLLLLTVRGIQIEFELAWLVGLGLYWRLDFISASLAALAAVIWLLAGIFARDYMHRPEKQVRFCSFFSLTLAAALGVFTAGDLLTFFLCFEVLTVAAYVLIAHEESRAALKAGDIYLYMSVAAGLSLLAAVLVIQHAVGHSRFEPILERLLASGVSPWLLMALLSLGFGIKAGLFPLHIWLPLAHPAAPTPASALLSGIMIKTGIYGFMRTLFIMLTPATDLTVWSCVQPLGLLLLWLGVASLLFGAVMALVNSSVKTILAYSSVSQMGYLAIALGAGVVLGPDGIFGLAGAWMHLLNHALFKSCLFLLAGAIALKTHTLDLRNLGGLARNMPLAFGFMVAAAATMTGLPGLNGYIGKVLIHDALLHAYHQTDWVSLLWLEGLFLVGSGLTVAYVVRLCVNLFLGPRQADAAQPADLPPTQIGLFSLYTAAFVGLGLFAEQTIAAVVVPAVSTAAHLAGESAALVELDYFCRQELQGFVTTYIIGLVILLFYRQFSHHLRRLYQVHVQLLWERFRSRWATLSTLLAYLQPRHWPALLQRDHQLWSSTPGDNAKHATAAISTPSRTWPERTQSSTEEAKAAKQQPDDNNRWSTLNLSCDVLIVALVLAVTLLLFVSFAL